MTVLQGLRVWNRQGESMTESETPLMDIVSPTSLHSPQQRTWATAREAYDYRGRGGWIHAYDLLQHTVHHPLCSGCTIHETEMWASNIAGRLCQHCLEIVNRYNNLAVTR